MTLGKIHLQMGELRHLGIGDILIPTHPYFSTQGVGQCRIGPYLLQLCAVAQGTISAYEITHVHKVISEDTSMNDEYNEMDETQYDDMRDDDYLPDERDSPIYPTAQVLAETETETRQDAQHQTHDVLPQIWATPVTLTLQAGQIRLTLNELSQLHVGSVLTATGELPGHATLYHGRQPVAQGELVDVDGQLGIQISISL
ncbi:FliM/FliN family flagellar motor switch protein [Vibrio sp. PP-XX7]